MTKFKDFFVKRCFLLRIKVSNEKILKKLNMTKVLQLISTPMTSFINEPPTRNINETQLHPRSLCLYCSNDDVWYTVFLTTYLIAVRSLRKSNKVCFSWRGGGKRLIYIFPFFCTCFGSFAAFRSLQTQFFWAPRSNSSMWVRWTANFVYASL